MKLAEYLAEHIKDVYGYNYVALEDNIQQGIEAFCSTEGVRVEVVGGTSRIIEEQIV